MRLLITGAAGFIGFHLVRRLLADGHAVVGYDGMTPGRALSLKRARSALLAGTEGFHAITGMLGDFDTLRRAVDLAAPEVIVHLAARTGVRAPAEEARLYVNANVVGSQKLLDAARVAGAKHILLASSSSVYGANPRGSFAEGDPIDAPLSLYAATKNGMEAIAHAHAHLYAQPITVFRPFTVYGPWGRPDMALFRFVDAIANDRPIDVYGDDRVSRDFTYVDDVVEAIVRLIAVIPGESNRASSAGATDTLARLAPFRVVNIGEGRPIELSEAIATIERLLGKRAVRNSLPMQPGDMPRTCADPALLEALTGFRPATPIASGLAALVAWYRDYTGGRA